MLSQTLRKPQVWLGLLISVVAFALVIWSLDLQAVGQTLVDSNWLLLIPAALAIVGFLAARAVRWRILLGRSLDYSPVFHIQNVGYFLGLILPLRLGDIVRTILIGRVPPVSFWQGASTMVIERLLDLLVIVLLFPFAVANLEQTPPTLQNAALVSGVAAAVGMVIFFVMARNRPLLERLIISRLPQSIGQRVDQLLDGLSAFNKLSDLLLVFVWSGLIWLVAGWSYSVVMQAVGLSLSFWEVSFVLCAAAFAVAIPSSPGQLGVFQAAVFFAIHTVMGYGEEVAFGFGILFHAVQYLTFAVVGLFGMAQTGQSWRALLDLANNQINGQ